MHLRSKEWRWRQLTLRMMMKKLIRIIRVVVVVACLSLAAGLVRAVIQLDMPVSRIVSTSQTVLLGKVERISVEKKLALVRITAPLPGVAATQASTTATTGETFRLVLERPEGLADHLAVGDPVVLFVSRAKDGTVAVLHVADRWILAKRVPDAASVIWNCVQEQDFKRSFPGPTSVLVDLLQERQNGGAGLLDAVRGKMLGLVPAGKLAPDAQFLAALGDGERPDLLVGKADGVRVYRAVGQEYQDQTRASGLAEARGMHVATGDVTGAGRRSVLLGNTLWINEGGAVKWRQVALDFPDDATVLAVGLVPAVAQGRANAAVLLKTGELRVFENPGPAGGIAAVWKARPMVAMWKKAEAPPAAVMGSWGHHGMAGVLAVRSAGVTFYSLDGQTAADHLRLTGEEPWTSRKATPKGLEVLGALPVALAGTGRMDLLVVGRGQVELLINRGYGAFFSDPGVTEQLLESKQPPAEVLWDPQTRWAAAPRANGRENLLVLTADGQLYIGQHGDK